MATPELTTPLAQEAYAVWRDEIEPRIKEITGPMAMLVKGLMMGIGPQMPTFFESLDQDQELQDKITARLRAALARIDAAVVYTIEAIDNAPVHIEVQDLTGEQIGPDESGDAG